MLSALPNRTIQQKLGTKSHFLAKDFPNVILIEEVSDLIIEVHVHQASVSHVLLLVKNVKDPNSTVLMKLFLGLLVLPHHGNSDVERFFFSNLSDIVQKKRQRLDTSTTKALVHVSASAACLIFAFVCGEKKNFEEKKRSSKDEL